jgi:predicted aspartyl protease
MNLKLKYGLPFVEVKLTHKGKSLSFDNFLIDTGSASTIIAAEIAVELGLGPEPLDVIRKIHGVGGIEYVYEKRINKIQLGAKKLTWF